MGGERARGDSVCVVESEEMKTIIALSCLLCVLCFAGADDLTCLLSVKQSVTDPSGVLSNWISTGNVTALSPCGFFGVSCNAAGAVVGIRLPACNLTGELPMDGLSQCTSIQLLDLSVNNFHGEIPNNAWNLMPTLTSFNVSFNNFTGAVTSNVTNTPHLQALQLQHNQFSGVLPWEIGILPNLTAFDVSFNGFQGQIPSTYSARSIVNQQNFPASSFSGNPGLCGAPLDIACFAH